MWSAQHEDGRALLLKRCTSTAASGSAVVDSVARDGSRRGVPACRR